MLTQHYIGVRMSVLFDFLSTLEELKKYEGRSGGRVDVMWMLNIFCQGFLSTLEKCIKRGENTDMGKVLILSGHCVLMLSGKSEEDLLRHVYLIDI